LVGAAVELPAGQLPERHARIDRHAGLVPAELSTELWPGGPAGPGGPTAELRSATGLRTGPATRQSASGLRPTGLWPAARSTRVRPARLRPTRLRPATGLRATARVRTTTRIWSATWLWSARIRAAGLLRTGPASRHRRGPRPDSDLRHHRHDRRTDLLPDRRHRPGCAVAPRRQAVQQLSDARLSGDRAERGRH